jgi:hypothetical protein
MKSCLVGYNAVWSVESVPTFRRNLWSLRRALLVAWFTLLSCLAYSTMKMEVTRFSETPVYFHLATTSREFGFRNVENLHTPVEHFSILVLFSLYSFGIFCSFCSLQFWNFMFLFFFSLYSFGTFCFFFCAALEPSCSFCSLQFWNLLFLLFFTLQFGTFCSCSFLLYSFGTTCCSFFCVQFLNFMVPPPLCSVQFWNFLFLFVSLCTVLEPFRLWKSSHSVRTCANHCGYSSSVLIIR